MPRRRKQTTHYYFTFAKYFTLINFMEHSHSPEGDGWSTDQEIPCLSWEGEIHYHLYDTSPRGNI
jgi:hypothetical protein